MVASSNLAPATNTSSRINATGREAKATRTGGFLLCDEVLGECQREWNPVFRRVAMSVAAAPGARCLSPLRAL